MLCERGGHYDIAKLLDYGLVLDASAGVDEKLTQSGMIVGTPAFMSPEQCAGEGDITSQSDIYSAGALGFYLLVGTPPFGARSAMQTLAAHLYEAPPDPSTLRPDIPPALAGIIMRCLEKAPANRYANVDEIETALRALAADGAWTNSHAREWWLSRQRPTFKTESAPA